MFWWMIIIYLFKGEIRDLGVASSKHHLPQYIYTFFDIGLSSASERYLLAFSAWCLKLFTHLSPVLSYNELHLKYLGLFENWDSCSSLYEYGKSFMCETVKTQMNMHVRKE